MAKLVVSKFGGTSMGDAACMLRSAEVVAQQDSCIVVVSATSGTTNDLIALGTSSQNKPWTETEAILEKIRTKHLKIAADLKIKPESEEKLETLFEEMGSLAKGVHLLKDCSVKAMDTLMSLGERMSSLLFTEAMAQILLKHNSSRKAELLDARDIVRTDDQFSKARPLTEEIKTLADAKLPAARLANTVFVT
ncbi:MAG: lysine-sensitive aspartokinase 3, partial [Proteobacteria bacterium]